MRGRRWRRGRGGSGRRHAPTAYAGVFLAVLTLGGCSAGDDGATPKSKAAESTSTPSETSASPAAPDVCGLLMEAEVIDLSGEVLSGPKPGVMGGVRNCQWGTLDDVGVQLINVAAGSWAEQLPDIIRQLQASGQFDDKENQRKLEEGLRLVESGANLTDESGCELFGTLLEIQGQSSTNDTTITLLPSETDVQAISGQHCSDGTFTSVVLKAPNLTGTPAEVQRVETALLTAVERR